MGWSAFSCSSFVFSLRFAAATAADKDIQVLGGDAASRFVDSWVNSTIGEFDAAITSNERQGVRGYLPNSSPYSPQRCSSSRREKDFPVSEKVLYLLMIPLPPSEFRFPSNSAGDCENVVAFTLSLVSKIASSLSSHPLGQPIDL